MKRHKDPKESQLQGDKSPSRKRTLSENQQRSTSAGPIDQKGVSWQREPSPEALIPSPVHNEPPSMSASSNEQKGAVQQFEPVPEPLYPNQPGSLPIEYAPAPTPSPAISSEPELVLEEPQVQEVPFHLLPQVGMEPVNEPEADAPTPLLLSEALNNLLFDENDREFEVEPDIFETSNTEFNSACTDPLYTGSKISFHESMVSILTLALTFKLSGVCLQAILRLISMHLPAKNIFKSSLYLFKNYFSFIQGPKSYSYYCSKCYEECDQKSGCSTCKNSQLCCLVKLSLVDQLQTMMNREGFYSKLDFEPHCGSEDIKDTYFGNLYQEQVKKGFLGRDGSLSFQWYADGAALYSVSKASVWPVYLTIDQLPYSERYKKENLLVPVIWVGPVKPPGNLLLLPLYSELQILYSGLKFNVRDLGEKVLRAVLLSGTGDTPARSIMLNMVQYNGASSCQACEQEGEPRPNVPGVRLFPYRPEEMVPRTVAKMVEYAGKATSDKPVVGVKGLTLLSKIMPDFVQGTAADPMHLIYGGISKKLLKLWTTSQKKDTGKWSISGSVETINHRLLSIKPPLHTQRPPISIKDLAYYKMSMFKAWFNEYSLPVLEGLLPDRYLTHHATLVAAIQYLSGDSVSNDDIATAKELLNKYLDQFADFYDPRFLTINFHLLIHLADLVRILGPMWVFTCFPLEHLNGIILALVHGTRFAEKQIAASVAICLGLPDLIRNLDEGSDSKAYCLSLTSRRQHKGKVVIDGASIVGPSQLCVDPPPCFSKCPPIPFTKMFRFFCLRRGRFLYTSLSSDLTAKRDSTAAVYESAEGTKHVGLIVEFLRLYQCNCPKQCSCDSKIVVVMQKLLITSYFKTLIPNVFVPNVHKYSRTETLLLINPNKLHGVCTQMNFNNSWSIARPLNTKEVE